MRVCPKCGFKDSPYWNASRYREVEICHIENFRELKPRLAKKLHRAGDIATDRYYAYLLRPSNHVERVELELYKAGHKSAFGIPREKYLKPLPKAQTKLLESQR